jgi:hypothetical protein
VNSVRRFGAARRLQRQAGRQHLIRELAGAIGVECALQELSDLRRFGVELIGEDADIVAVPHELGFQVVNLAGQEGLDYLNGYRLLANAERLFERQKEVLLDLQRCPKFCGQEVDRSVVDQLCRRRFLSGAGLEQPIDVIALVAGDAVEGRPLRDNRSPP